MAFQALLPLIPFAGRMLGGLAGMAGRLPGIGAIAQQLGSSIPHLENEAIVTVVGQPGAKKKDLYYLAMATAMGLVGRSDFSATVFGTQVYIAPPPGLIMIEYDAADNWVRATVKYRTSTITALAELGSAQKFYTDTAVYAGPDDFVTAANFNFTSLTAPGIPTSAVSPGYPRFPFAGRDVLTAGAKCYDPNPQIALGQGNVIPSPNPKPPGDNRSRGVAWDASSPEGANPVAKLIPLVFAALSDPGTADLQVFPAPTFGPLGG